MRRALPNFEPSVKSKEGMIGELERLSDTLKLKADS